jgi:DinB superfamily
MLRRTRLERRRRATLDGVTGEEYARRFEQEQQRLIDLIEPLTEAEWSKVGANYPQRMNDEDEQRPVGVIAHHVAVSCEAILDRIVAAADGRPPAPVSDFRASNADHARDNAGVTKEEVLELLRRQTSHVTARLRELDDQQLERTTETRVGPMTVAQRIERVLIGHVTMHRGSIEAALS